MGHIAYQRVLGRLHEDGVDLPVGCVVAWSVSWAHGERGGASSAAPTEALQRRELKDLFWVWPLT